jgi:hypothetical protein
MKSITQFERVKDGAIFGRNENGTFSMLPLYAEHLNHEWTEDKLLSCRPEIVPVYEKCKCTWCEDLSPRVKRVSAALNTPELKADFEHLMATWGAESLDLDVAKSKLEGVWPGWEWMVEANEIHLKGRGRK